MNRSNITTIITTIIYRPLYPVNEFILKQFYPIRLGIISCRNKSDFISDWVCLLGNWDIAVMI